MANLVKNAIIHHDLVYQEIVTYLCNKIRLIFWCNSLQRLRIFLVLIISFNGLYENDCMNQQRNIASTNSISLKLKRNSSYLKIIYAVI